jgi:hypothetical protein
VTETYLHHAIPDQEGLDRDAGLQHVARVINLIRQANDLEFDLAFTGMCERKYLMLCGINTDIEMLISDYPDPELLDDISLTCTPDIFLETLMGNIRNTLISFQAWINKISNSRINAINKTLSSLKKDYQVNCNEIFRLERDLAEIRDAALTQKIQEIKLFDNLHNEKPSPLFLNLIKRRNTDELSCIKSDKGESFRRRKNVRITLSHFMKNFSGSQRKERTLTMKTASKHFWATTY